MGQRSRSPIARKRVAGDPIEHRGKRDDQGDHGDDRDDPEDREHQRQQPQGEELAGLRLVVGDVERLDERLDAVGGSPDRGDQPDDQSDAQP
jgi:hypothetical protein